MKSCAKFCFVFVALLFLFSPFLLTAEIQVKVIQSREDLPEPFSALARKGDYLLSDGRSYALIGATARPLRTSANYPFGNSLGSILGFLPAGKKLAADVNIGHPVLRIKDKTHHLAYSQVGRTVSGGEEADLTFQAAGFFEDQEGRKAEIKTTYAFRAEKGQIDISSAITNTGKDAFEDLSFSLFFDAYARYYFNPYHEKKFPRLNFRVYQKKGHWLGWVNFNPVEKQEARFPGRLAPGERCELKYILLTEESPEILLESLYQILDIKPQKAAVEFRDFEGDWLELVVREALTSSIFFRAVLEKPLFFEVLLPPGFYRFQANFFPATVEELAEISPGGENSCQLQNPPHGTVEVKIRNSRGEHVPGKVTFIGLHPTKTPYFQPDNPVETGRSWEGFKNSCYPGEEGLEVKLPVGTYLAYSSCGPEFTVDQEVLEVLKDEHLQIVFVIDKVVKTSGLISLDPHMHTRKSDGSVSIAERIRSVAAEGVEVAVAADHNTITDYSTDLEKLGLAESLAVIPGSEVTTPDLVHFNSYPMEIRPDEEGNGAVGSAAEEAGTLFLASRQKNPGALVQVNHPRAGDLGYFNNHYLDQESARAAINSFSTNFNLLEVLNGPHYYASNKTAIEDWFHLLKRGYYFPIVGSSDAHAIDRDEPGYSQTYVYYSGEKGDRLDRASLLQALRKGRSFVTNGPLIEFTVNGRPALGDLLLAKSGRVDVRVGVWSAPWVAFNEVRLILNGERRIIFPVRAEDAEVNRFEQEISLTLKEDAFLCLEVLGRRTLFPVLQRPSRSGLLEDGTIPYALTNPIFVDADGNGKFDPPLPQKIELTAEPAGLQKKVCRY